MLNHALTIYKTPQYSIQKIADRFSTPENHIKIIFLPVGHPELNPIEMVWSIIKCNVASRNLEFSLTKVEQETRKEVSAVTREQFKKYYRHALQEEVKYRNLSQTWDEQEEINAVIPEVEIQDENIEIQEADLFSKGPSYCHVDGCLQEDRNTATGHNCHICKRSIHLLYCTRILGIVVEDSDTPLFCCDCFKNK